MDYLYFDILPKELIEEISQYSSLFDLLEFRKISEWTRLGSEKVFQEKLKIFKRIHHQTYRMIHDFPNSRYVWDLTNVTEKGDNARLKLRYGKNRIRWVELRHNVVTSPERYNQLNELLNMIGI